MRISFCLFFTGVKDTAFEFKGKQDSYLEIPNDKHQLDAKNSITLLANVYPTGEDGPILNYQRDGWGVHIWQFDKTMLFVRFVSRDDGMTTQPLATRVLQVNASMTTQAPCIPAVNFAKQSFVMKQ